MAGLISSSCILLFRSSHCKPLQHTLFPIQNTNLHFKPKQNILLYIFIQPVFDFVRVISGFKLVTGGSAFS